ncbi:hypothetical protein D3C76_214160 [compost metagenome]
MTICHISRLDISTIAHRINIRNADTCSARSRIADPGLRIDLFAQTGEVCTLNDLHLELRRLQGVAVVGQREVVENDVRQAPISRRAPYSDVGFNARIWQLVVGAAVQAPALGRLVGGDDGFQVIAAGVVDQLVHAPDAPDSGDLTFAQGQGEGGEVGVGLGGSPATAALAAGFLLLDDFLELVVFQPQHVSGKRDGAVNPWDALTVGAGLYAEVVEARAGDGGAFRRVEVPADRHTDLSAIERPGWTSDDEANYGANDTAGRLAKCTHSAPSNR